jgi:hypothetical protein
MSYRDTLILAITRQHNHENTTMKEEKKDAFKTLHTDIINTLRGSDVTLSIAVLMSLIDQVLDGLNDKDDSNYDSSLGPILARLVADTGSKYIPTYADDNKGTNPRDVVADMAEYLDITRDEALSFASNEAGCFTQLNKEDHWWMSGNSIFEMITILRTKS